jgi:cytochrome c-type biogenesis protein CcmH
VAIWIAALMLIGSAALFVAAPLTELFGTDGRAADDEEAARLEHQRSLATSAIRELEFDHATGKIAEAEFRALREELETRALEAMAALERLQESRLPKARARSR